MRISSASFDRIPFAAAYSPTAVSRLPSPRVRMYWKAPALSFSTTSARIWRNASTGNVSGLGCPGAKEMMPGRSMSALIRRMAENRISRAAAERRDSWLGIRAQYNPGPAASRSDNCRPGPRTTAKANSMSVSEIVRHRPCKER